MRNAMFTRLQLSFQGNTDVRSSGEFGRRIAMKAARTALVVTAYCTNRTAANTILSFRSRSEASSSGIYHKLNRSQDEENRNWGIVGLTFRKELVGLCSKIDNVMAIGPSWNVYKEKRNRKDGSHEPQVQLR